MNNRFAPDTPRRTAHGWLAIFFVALAAACGEDARQDPALPRPAPTQAPPRTPVFVVAPEAAAATVVTGKLVDADGRGVADRRVTFVDARGSRTDVTTDDAGRFAAPALVTPYDVMVAAAGDGSTDAPVAYLGISRADLWLESTNVSRVGSLAASQTVRAGYELPSCPGGACWSKVVTHSVHGDGASAIFHRSTDGAGVVVDVDHGWTVPVLPPGEVLDVTVLVGDSGYSAFWYGHAASVRAAAGEVTDVGMVALSPVAATAPLPMSGEGTDLPGNWQWNLAAWLELPGGGAMSLQYVDGPALVSRLPRVPGTSLRVGVWAQAPSNEGTAYFHASSYGWSGPLALDVTSVVVPIGRGPRPLRPPYPEAIFGEEGNGSSLSRTAEGFSWEHSHGVAALAVASATRGGLLFRAYTGGSVVPFARLERLGIARPRVGAHVLDLSTGEGEVLDERLDPDPRVRRSRARPGIAAGASTHLRFLFEVTD